MQNHLTKKNIGNSPEIRKVHLVLLLFDLVFFFFFNEACALCDVIRGTEHLKAEPLEPHAMSVPYIQDDAPSQVFVPSCKTTSRLSCFCPLLNMNGPTKLSAKTEHFCGRLQTEG